MPTQSSCWDVSHLVCEVACEVLVLSVEVLVIKLCQPGSEDMLAAEEGVMGEDEP